MSFGENLQFYRKRQNITQEQLAEQMEVSRQTVSKWEAGASYPEMEKLMQLCGIFSCSMDILLRGTAEDSVHEDTEDYDAHMNTFGKRITCGIAVILFGLSVMQLMTGFRVHEALATAVMLVFVVVGVLIFVVAGMQNEYFRKKHPEIRPFYSEETIESFEKKFPVYIAAGVGLILAGVIFIVISELLPVPAGGSEDIYTAVFLFILTVAVPLIVYAGMQKEKYDIEKYNKENKREPAEEEKGKIIGVWCGCIMMAAVILFLVGGFVWEAWKISWVVFPVGGILCGIVSSILSVRKTKQ